MVGVVQPPIPPIQPHQGRNPCIERNLIRDIPQEPSISGNTLIDLQDDQPLRATYNTANIMEVLEAHQSLDSHLLVNEHLVPLLNGYAPSSTQPAQVQQQQPRIPQPQPVLNPPIPYLQNEVHIIEARPKKQNLPQENRQHGAGSSWRRWKAAWGDKLHSILPRRRRDQHNGDEERQEILVTPTSSSHSEPPTPLGSSHISLPPSNLDLAPRQTQVLLSNGNPQTIVSQSDVNEDKYSPDDGCIAETEIGIAKLQYQCGFMPIIKSRQGSKDSGLNKSSESSMSYIDNESSSEKLRRPTTLQLCDQVRNQNLAQKSQNNSTQEIVEVVNRSEEEKVNHDGNSSTNISIKVFDDFNKSIESLQELEDEEPPPVKLRKPKHRVKTPRKPILPRLSLYDDRIMGSTATNASCAPYDRLENNNCLSHSLPLDMESLGDCRQQKSLQSSKVSNGPDINYSSLKVLKSEAASSNNQLPTYSSLPRQMQFLKTAAAQV